MLYLLHSPWFGSPMQLEASYIPFMFKGTFWGKEKTVSSDYGSACMKSPSPQLWKQFSCMPGMGQHSRIGCTLLIWACGLSSAVCSLPSLCPWSISTKVSRNNSSTVEILGKSICILSNLETLYEFLLASQDGGVVRTERETGSRVCIAQGPHKGPNIWSQSGVSDNMKFWVGL